MTNPSNTDHRLGKSAVSALAPNLRRQLENTVKQARKKSEEGASAALERLSIGEAKAHKQLQKSEQQQRRQLRAKGLQLGDKRAGDDTQSIIHLKEACAYEYWHRMLFARFLAENGLLIHSGEGVAVSLDDVEELAQAEGTDRWTLAGRYASAMLPEIFRPDDPLLQLEFAPEHKQALEKLLAALPNDVFVASDSLGWVYQFWQADRKDEVNAAGNKIGADELSAVTQLFTEDYMVDFLLDNTLGAWWAGKHLQPRAPASSQVDRGATERSRLLACAALEDDCRKAVALPGVEWKYLRFVKHDPKSTGFGGLNTTESDPTSAFAGLRSAGLEPTTSGLGNQRSNAVGSETWLPAAGTFDGWPKTARELTCIDPCMGSGHFVVAMFERLVSLRVAEEGLTEKAAVEAVLRENLFGLELDPRCTQIAAFNLALAAWKRVGHCALPPLNLACSGLAPNATLEEWLSLAQRAKTKHARQIPADLIHNGLVNLYGLFKDAPTLGSLINPMALGSVVSADYETLLPFLAEAFTVESDDVETHERAVAAQGMVKAAEILAGEYTLVVTNVPYLTRGKQDDKLKDYSESVHPQSKSDLATCFIERCIQFSNQRGSAALVTPQNWLFLGTYAALRRTLLRTTQFNFLTGLGEHGFDSPQAAGAFTAMFILSRIPNSESHVLRGIDVSELRSATAKSLEVKIAELRSLNQFNLNTNPDARITLETASYLPLLSKHTDCYAGMCSGDYPRFGRRFWELESIHKAWEFLETSVTEICDFSGKTEIFLWEDGIGQYAKYVDTLDGRLGGSWKRGGECRNKRAVLVSSMRELPATFFVGGLFDNNCAVILPHASSDLPALWAFCSSESFNLEVRKIDKKMNVTNATMVKVPFDLAHWQKVAAEKYPDGLPKPHSDDPTQWLFNGQPAGSMQPLQVAVARLLGYRWPRQTGSSFPDCPALGPDGLEAFEDDDGIVCLSSVRGEAPAAERLRELLAYANAHPPESAHGAGKLERQTVTQKVGDDKGTYNPASVGSPEHQLDKLAITGSAADPQTGNLKVTGAAELDEWLRTRFFEEHFKLFHHRPFIWHIWDGRKDGFNALVNYHKLDFKLLEKLTYTYLGDWIKRQEDAVKLGASGADDRLLKARELQKKLALILTGDAPYDIFVRWKKLEDQPAGWHPDLNDGVRLNIRPFMTADVLRKRPNIKWGIDRGKNPPGAPWGEERDNDRHLGLEEKLKAKR